MLSPITSKPGSRVESKPATLRCFIRIRFLGARNGFSVSASDSANGEWFRRVFRQLVASFPKLPPTDLNSINRDLGGSDGFMPKTTEIPANASAHVPRTPRKRFERIGKRHRY
jgi:hypothetical protein